MNRIRTLYYLTIIFEIMLQLPQYTYFVKKITIGLLPLLIIFSGMPALSSSMKVSVKFPETKPGRGSTQRTVGGGQRGQGVCLNLAPGKTPPTVLIPTNNSEKTVSTNPTFYVYVPKINATSAVFRLEDENEKSLYQQKFQLPKQGGILKINIPDTAALKINNKYIWIFGIICDPGADDSGINPFVRNSLKRTTLTPYQNWYFNLKNVTPLQKAKTYTKLGLWHEALSTLADLRSQYPKEWEELLQSVGLEDIAKEPVLDCCTKVVEPESP